MRFTVTNENHDQLVIEIEPGQQPTFEAHPSHVPTAEELRDQYIWAAEDEERQEELQNFRSGKWHTQFVVEATGSTAIGKVRAVFDESGARVYPRRLPESQWPAPEGETIVSDDVRQAGWNIEALH